MKITIHALKRLAESYSIKDLSDEQLIEWKRDKIQDDEKDIFSILPSCSDIIKMAVNGDTLTEEEVKSEGWMYIDYDQNSSYVKCKELDIIFIIVHKKYNDVIVTIVYRERNKQKKACIKINTNRAHKKWRKLKRRKQKLMERGLPLS